MRVIICGSRDWADPLPIERELIGLRQDWGPGVTVVEGAARGADRIAGQVARRLGIPVEEHPADWTGRGKAAGFERNKLMLSLGPSLVLAFKDGFDTSLRRGGTEHMVRIALEADVPVMVIGHRGNSYTVTPAFLPTRGMA